MRNWNSKLLFDMNFNQNINILHLPLLLLIWNFFVLEWSGVEWKPIMGFDLWYNAFKIHCRWNCVPTATRRCVSAMFCTYSTSPGNIGGNHRSKVQQVCSPNEFWNIRVVWVYLQQIHTSVLLLMCYQFIVLLKDNLIKLF